MRHLCWTFGLFIGLVGCTPDQTVTLLRPEITLAPNVVDFGEQGVLTESVQTVYISNGGRVDLDLDLSWRPSLAVFSVPSETYVVEPGETAAVELRFVPDTFLAFETELLITSNDVESPEITLPVTGVGIDAPLPDIDLEALFMDFGTVPLGSSATKYLALNNVGRANLSLGEIGQTGSGAFSLGFDPSGQTIAPDNTIPLILSYTPSQSAGDSGALLFPSNDPDEPLVELVLIGNGGGDFDYPIADIDCPGQSEPPTWVTLDGSASTDPAGYEPLTFQWAIVTRPSYSQGELSDTITESTNLFTDVAGHYVVSLVVENTIGLKSPPTKCSLDAIPADDLHIELTWDTSRADLDLHLLEDGADFFERPGDCNFCNPNPSWGAAGGEDDPRLDLDDRAGFGPENINIKSPANGKYPLRVHYFDDQGDSAVVAKVRIYTYGLLADELSRVMHRNDVWDVAQINWPAGTVGVLSTELYTPTVRSCY